jgi:hypothetical protein
MGHTGNDFPPSFSYNQVWPNVSALSVNKERVTSMFLVLRQSRLLVTLLLACLLGVSAIPASPALAATECTSELNGVTIQGNVTVPNGLFCILIGSTVTGNVSVGQGAFFQAIGTTIQGKVSGAGALAFAFTAGTVVKGSVTASGTFETLLIDRSRVSGNVTATGNPTSVNLEVRESTIGGNLTVSGNATANPANIENNSVGGNLICDGNTPAPVGSGNAVSGRKTGQCTGF